MPYTYEYYCSACGNKVKSGEIKCKKCKAFLSLEGAIKTKKIKTNEEVKEDYSEIGGWLILFVFSLYISIIIYFYRLMEFIFLTEGSISEIGIWLIISYLIILFYLVCCVILMHRRKKTFIKTGNTTLWLIFGINALWALISYFLTKEISDNFYTFVWALISVFIWTNYLKNTERCKKTFIKD